MLVKVQVLRAYDMFSVGDIIPEMPGNVARMMMARGYVAEMIEEPASKALRSPLDRAIKPRELARRYAMRGQYVDFSEKLTDG